MLACIVSLSDSPPNLKCPVYEFGHHMYHLAFMLVACATTLAGSRSFHLGGRAELYQGKYRPDPRNFAGVEQILDPSKFLSTSCPKPGFGPPVDPRNSAGVENWSNMPGSSRFWQQAKSDNLGPRLSTRKCCPIKANVKERLPGSFHTFQGKRNTWHGVNLNLFRLSNYLRPSRHRAGLETCEAGGKGARSALRL